MSGHKKAAAIGGGGWGLRLSGPTGSFSYRRRFAERARSPAPPGRRRRRRRRIIAAASLMEHAIAENVFRAKMRADETPRRAVRVAVCDKRV